MELIKLKSSNNTENKDISHYNHIREQLWFWVFGIIALLAILWIMLYFLRKYIQGPRYQKHNRLEGKVVIITGCNRGIGKETALEMARRGAKVYMACRNYEKCEEARLDIIKQTRNQQVFNRTLDLSSLESVKQFVEQFLKEEHNLHILINNAAIITKKRQLSSDGYELQLATNHLGHFLLTNLLLDTLKNSAPSRIITISSNAHILALLNKQDLQSEKSFIWFKAFLQSKFCNTLFTLKLAELLQDTSVTANCLYPGLVLTDLLYENTWCLFHPLLKFFAKSIKSGAQTAIYLALDPELEDKSGGFYVDMKQAYMPPWVRDSHLAHWLWQESLKMVGLE
ncbi:retinol dehydrogenase 12-like [Lucilia sericata]|uniref:retinol dehydrogenase 12-like n=1 Tax=Lucilia sericata TaxID=13632 RepID=UPI0018A84982|nr:retinol dehydrogenase 12-like [Lucilia sericata]